MQRFDDFRVVADRDNPILKVRSDDVRKKRLKERLHRSRTNVLRDDPMRRVIRLKSVSEELSAEKTKMVLDRQCFALVMQMFEGGGPMAAGDDSQGVVLNDLKCTERCLTHIRKNDRRRVVVDRRNKSLESTE